MHIEFLVWPMSYLTTWKGPRWVIYCSQPPGGDGGALSLYVLSVE